jgi:tripartite-type tricarboxylate transporter receptor subunit TctC
MLTDVVGGQLDVGTIDFSGTIELMKGGRIRVLAIQLREYQRFKRVADAAGIKPE